MTVRNTTGGTAVVGGIAADFDVIWSSQATFAGAGSLSASPNIVGPTAWSATAAFAGGGIFNFIEPTPPFPQLLLHMDGANGATVFVDATRRHTITTNGNAKIDTGWSRFGGASANFS